MYSLYIYIYRVMLLALLPLAKWFLYTLSSILNSFMCFRTNSVSVYCRDDTILAKMECCQFPQLFSFNLSIVESQPRKCIARLKLVKCLRKRVNYQVIVKQSSQRFPSFPEERNFHRLSKLYLNSLRGKLSRSYVVNLTSNIYIYDFSCDCFRNNNNYFFFYFYLYLIFLKEEI